MKLGRALLTLAAVVLVSGTVVTGAGPHSGGGKHDNVPRIDVPFTDVVRVHSGLVWVFLATVIATVLIAHRDRTPRAVMNRLTLLLVVLVGQGVIGYVQYFNDIPALLVGFHVAGAAAVWSTTLWFYFGLFERHAVAPTAGSVGVAGARRHLKDSYRGHAVRVRPGVDVHGNS